MADAERMRRMWNTRGRRHPIRSICTGRFRGLSVEAFFASGAWEIDRIFEYLEGLDLHPGTRRALDFGCGLGRLTQALAPRFQEVVGLDISDEMIRRAEALNRAAPAVRYLADSRGDPGVLPAGTFDFIVSDLVLQHIEPRSSRSYIAALVRLLAPEGVAVLQIPGSVVRRGLTPRLVARRAGATHGLDPREVRDLARDAGGTVVDSRSSPIPYAGLADILAPASETRPPRRGSLPRWVSAALADQRPSFAYVIRKPNGAP